MVEPEAVAAMLRLKELGWGSKRIARELGVNRRTVKRYLGTGGWQPYKKPKRQKLLEGLENWLRERLHRHRGNADVVRLLGLGQPIHVANVAVYLASDESEITTGPMLSVDSRVTIY